MQSSDVSAYLNLSPTSDVGVQKRTESAAPSPFGASVGTSVARLDTTSVSAGARALTVTKQAEIASQLSIERIQQLRQARPEPEKIAAAILRAELDDDTGT